MIPDIGWIEMLVIASLAIVVVGPKDLPKLLRALGNWVGKARGMAREFQKSFDDIAREADLDDLRAQVDALNKTNPLEEVKKALDPTDELRGIDQDLKEAVEADLEPNADADDTEDTADTGETALSGAKLPEDGTS